MIRLSFISLLLIILSGCDTQRTTKQDPQIDPHRETIEAIIDSEAMILELGPYVAKIADSLTQTGETSKESLRQYFTDKTNYVREDGAPVDAVDNLLEELWQPFLSDRKFTECQFGTLSGTLDESNQRFNMKTKFEGKIHDGQKVIGVYATQIITWTRINKLWTITDWNQDSFKTNQLQTPLFANATNEFIQDPETRVSVSTSSHELAVLNAIEQKSVMEALNDGSPGFNDWESFWQFPSISVVDYDNDGWDDICLTNRWTGGTLLRNNKGTFIDATDESGLAIGPNANCTIFADFDNDGDADVFIGRSLQDSQYFVNENGTFRLDPSMEEELKFVRFVTAGSVADFNGDGLLDLYLSTYASPSGSASKSWFKTMTAESDHDRMAKVVDQHPFVNRGGPANILLINEGGKLKRCKANETITQWRNSFQSTWHDWDDDGDVDLFVCNDFAPDAFLRNDTVKGSNVPVFVDVTEELIGPDIMGYSMGASWGDYDNDGDMDLYVSEMYSKAGNRILKQFAQADSRSIDSAKGSFLFRNDGGKLTQVAGSEGLHVDKVGWSFGGQFVDLDNNGWLDLYAPSGFYTAPKSVRSDADL